MEVVCIDPAASSSTQQPSGKVVTLTPTPEQLLTRTCELLAYPGNPRYLSCSWNQPRECHCSHGQTALSTTTTGATHSQISAVALMIPPF